jgi:hypothetical protein
MADATCPRCRRRFGWPGDAADCPGCPRCGWKPDPASLAADQAEVEAFREYLRRRHGGAAQPAATKAEYVRGRVQTREHHCHWPGCPAQVPPALWGCRRHWFLLPKALRDRVWAAYRPGQEEDMAPGPEYLEVAAEVQRWIRENYP